MRFLITRPQSDASQLAQWLMQLGHEAIVSPVIEIFCVDTPRPDPAPFQGLIITSRNALRCLAKTDDLGSFRDLPLFAVGAATARQAQEFGFSEIHQGPGRAIDLIPVINAEYEKIPNPQLFHPGGAKKAFDLAPHLRKSGIELVELVVYESRLCKNLTQSAIEAITSAKLGGVILMSPRTAEHFRKLVIDNHLEKEMSHIPCLCLSPKVAKALKNMPCKEKPIARAPDLGGIMELIDSNGKNK
jgi:uroporphyrinogen-III synthase